MSSHPTMKNVRRASAALLLLLASGPVSGDLNDDLQLITTPVLALRGTETDVGTAFFYQRLAPGDSSNPGPQWRAVEKVWLVTNRHVLLGKPPATERVPAEFRFHLRRVVGSKLEWEPVRLDTAALRQRARVHPDPKVDVVVIEVGDLLLQRAASGDPILQWRAVSGENLAGQNKIAVEVADDVIAIGYPRGFYDEANLYPIVKSGIVASRWGSNFNGLPHFLIDAKLFPGSSGSLVISKPRDFVIENGQLFTSPQKQFAFLGVFSGEPYRQGRPIELEQLVVVEKLGYNLGVVWYPSTIEEAIANGSELPTP